MCKRVKDSSHPCVIYWMVTGELCSTMLYLAFTKVKEAALVRSAIIGKSKNFLKEMRREPMYLEGI